MTVSKSEIRQEAKRTYDDVFRKSLEETYPEDRVVWKKAIRTVDAHIAKRWEQYREDIRNGVESEAFRDWLVWKGVLGIVTKKYGERFIKKVQ